MMNIYIYMFSVVLQYYYEEDDKVFVMEIMRNVFEVNFENVIVEGLNL